jgi:hypothetical protein
MAAGVTASIDLRISAMLRGAAHGGASPQILAAIEKALEFSAGTAAISQANLLYFETRSLAASTGEDLDLAGSLADPLGATIAAAELVFLYIGAAAANTNDVQLTRPAANGVPLFLAAGDGVPIGPGDFFLFTNRKGIAVTAATGDLVHLLNGGAGTSVSYDVLALGRTVAA